MSGLTGNLVYAHFTAVDAANAAMVSGCQIFPPANSRGCWVVRYQPINGNNTYMHWSDSNYLTNHEQVIVPIFKSDELYTFLTSIKTGRRSPSPSPNVQDYTFRAGLNGEMLVDTPIFIAPGTAVTFLRQTENAEFEASFGIAEPRL